MAAVAGGVSGPGGVVIFFQPFTTNGQANQIAVASIAMVSQFTSMGMSAVRGRFLGTKGVLHSGQIGSIPSSTSMSSPR